MTAPTREELLAHHADIIVATLPLVGAHIDEITTEFYRGLFDAHPDLLRNLFNRGNQAQGAQQRALAASIATFAAHLVDPALPHPADLLSRIGHKHASLGITADKYPIVQQHLFAAIVSVLGADVVSEEVAAAWDRVYWIMADTLIALERDLYRAAGVPEGDVYRRMRVITRVDDPSGAVVITVACGERFEVLPGQYVSVGVTLPDGSRQLRQYSLVNAGDEELTFVVKPAGEVSRWIQANLCVGDLLDVTVPFGDLPTPAPGVPLVLISAGIGVTPMIGLLEHLALEAPDTRVQVLHADRDDTAHPLRTRQRELVAALPHATLDIWYEDGVTGGEARIHAGRINLERIRLLDDAHVYLCGTDGFVRAVRPQLAGQGLPAERVHCELFSPNDWLLG
ncbi:MAG: hemoglobin-like flavoprotein [Mycobacterium sp.]|nr:hemoglobin-like flavoprotein [Mycobacterium sp.]